VEGLAANGHDTGQAKVVLAGLEESLAAHRARRDLIRDALDEQRREDDGKLGGRGLSRDS
jgi:hypothetical protein